MKLHITKRVAIIFFIAYSVASTFGLIFLVTWGGTNWYKEAMIFMGTYPINWNKLIVEDSIWWIPANVVFWTITVFLVAGIIEITFKLIYKTGVFQDKSS